MSGTGRFDACPRHEYSVIRIKDDEAEKVAMAGSPTALKSIGRTIIIRTSICHDESSTDFIYIYIYGCYFNKTNLALTLNVTISKITISYDLYIRVLIYP